MASQAGGFHVTAQKCRETKRTAFEFWQAAFESENGEIRRERMDLEGVLSD